MKIPAKTISLMCLLSLYSCGRDDGGTGHTPRGTWNQPNNGLYRAILRPVNPALSGWIPNGKLEITIDAKEFQASSWLDDAAAVAHPQHIHSGTRCPSAIDDRNSDGVIDFEEAITAAKEILIPLDDDLSSQAAGFSFSPQGNYTYRRHSLIDSLLSDLTLDDEDIEDHFTKIPRGKALNLAGRVIIVYGIAKNKELPPSIRTSVGQSPQQSIPIVCGRIERLETE